ncbi:MAG TPA: hypothetical protein VHT29_07550 [Solirubrobacteraceae bacterium]|jgi:hypothetical protein|nr:hypothetical protein [Solirubrobacteraceae bacterium]
MTRLNLSVVVIATAALLLAGCGSSSSSPGVAHLSSSTSSSSETSGGGSSSSSESRASVQQKMVAYSHCMRTHGVPEFPEPTEGKLLVRGSDRNGHLSGPNPNSAHFQAAQKVCAKLAPNEGKPPSAAEQAKLQEKALKFSACMRSHGVPNFPDPEFHSGGGGASIRLGSKKSGPGGLDPNSPQFQAAQKACFSIMGGPKGGPGPGGPGGQSGAVAVAP